MEVAGRCQLRQLVSSKAPSALGPRSTLPRRLATFAAASSCSCSCPLRDGNRRAHGVRASESTDTDAPAFVPPRPRRPPRFLCLHGFRTSGEIMRKQVLGKWPADVTARLDLVFADAPFPAEGKSDVDGIFDPPYYEWFQFDKVRRRARASARPLPAPSPPILPDPVVPAYFSLCLFFCTRAACRWLVRCTYQLDLPTRATHLLPNSLCTVQRKTEFYGVQEFRQVPGLHRRADDKRRPLRRTDGFLPGNKPHSTG